MTDNLEKQCVNCRYFYPDEEFDRIVIRWLPYPKFIRKPSSKSFRYAICSGYGGGYASVERRLTCKNGEGFIKK